MQVYVATKNPGKVRELQAIFGVLGWQLKSDADYADPVEGAESYADNAADKARALRAQLLERGIRASVLGDDSGLEVLALGGRPGVLSARYGGAGVTWAQRRQMLLAEVDAAAEDRTAAFVCALHFIDAGGQETATLRRLYGAIASGERGERGFSYDPIFLFPPLGATFGEMAEAQKNAISHRARAARALALAVKAEAAGSDAENGGGIGT